MYIFFADWAHERLLFQRGRVIHPSGPVRPRASRRCHGDLIAAHDNRVLRRRASAPRARSPRYRSRAVSERPPKSLLLVEERRGAGTGRRESRGNPRSLERERRYVRYERCTAVGAREAPRARYPRARRAEPIDLATFPSGGELTSPPSASASVCPHHLTHLVEPPPD